VKIHGIDEDAALQIAERGVVANQAADQNVERFATVDRGSKQAAESDIGASYLEDVPATH